MIAAQLVRFLPIIVCQPWLAASVVFGSMSFTILGLGSFLTYPSSVSPFTHSTHLRFVTVRREPAG